MLSGTALFRFQYANPIGVGQGVHDFPFGLQLKPQISVLCNLFRMTRDGDCLVEGHPRIDQVRVDTGPKIVHSTKSDPCVGQKTSEETELALLSVLVDIQVLIAPSLASMIQKQRFLRVSAFEQAEQDLLERSRDRPCDLFPLLGKVGNEGQNHILRVDIAYVEHPNGVSPLPRQCSR